MSSWPDCMSLGWSPGQELNPDPSCCRRQCYPLHPQAPGSSGRYEWLVWPRCPGQLQGQLVEVKWKVQNDVCAAMINIKQCLSVVSEVLTVEKFKNSYNGASNAALAPSCNDLVSYLNTRLKGTPDTLAPVKWKKNLHTHKNLWINADIRQLKRNCRKSKRLWRKTKLQVHYDILKDQISVYNNAMKISRQSNLSSIINKNKDNTIDQLINPNLSASASHGDLSSKICGVRNSFKK